MTVFDLRAVKKLVDAALAEDIGRGDLTTAVTVEPETAGKAEILAKQVGVLAGLPLVEQVFQALGGRVRVETHVAEGADLVAGLVVATITGPARDLLAGERVVLNFLQHLSGVATLTKRFVDEVAETKARIVDTRKTLPGFRVIDKYAVRVGGGHNHRLGLDDGILIKDNHIAAAGGITPAVRRARALAPHTVRIEIECGTLAEVDEALAAGVDIVLLDNMTVEQMAHAVEHIAGRALVEASGNVSLDNVRAIAETGVDLISVGSLTHSAPAVDLSMRLQLVGA